MKPGIYYIAQWDCIAFVKYGRGIHSHRLMVETYVSTFAMLPQTLIAIGGEFLGGAS